MFETLQKL